MNKEGQPIVVNKESFELDVIFNEIKIEFDKYKALERDLLKFKKEISGDDKTGQAPIYVLNSIEKVKNENIRNQKAVFDALVKKHEGAQGLDEFLKKIKG